MKTQIPKRLEQVGQGNMDLINSMFAINDLIDYITELTTVVVKQQALINNLRGGWTDVEINQAAFKPWPQYNDTVFAISSQMRINEHCWRDSAKDKTKLSVGMIFKTREEAEAKVEAIIGLNK